jgi:formate hydrogenlyase subunit 4
VSPALPIPVVQCLQVFTIAGAAPGVSGVISKVEARLQGRVGPRVLQPYYDIAKLFRKEALAPDGSSWVFLAGAAGRDDLLPDGADADGDRAGCPA